MPSVSRVLVADGITKSYAGVHALRSASLELLAGEVHALVGENGAGKSTLTKIITGSVQRDAGSLQIFGQEIVDHDTNQSRSMGIAAIYQQPSIFPDLTVSENIALALERDGSWRIDWKARHQHAKTLIESLGTSIDPERLASSLSMAEQQIVEIAKAVGANARILIMDEPTALLSERETANLFQLVRKLRDDGVSILYISHRLDEILKISDRITVLRDGQTIATKIASGVNSEQLIELMVGRTIASIFPKRDVPFGKVVLEVSGLSYPESNLHDVSFSVRAGEIFGLAGLVGSGRTELARVLFGITPSESEFTLEQRQLRVSSPASAIQAGIGYLPEDRRQHGLILDMTITENISMVALDRVSHLGLINHEKEEELATHYQHELKIKAPDTSSAANLLSGGNQQKVALARWLAVNPRVMILDEPTQGVDVGSKSEIHELIVQLAEKGMAIILISSELPEVISMSDRIGVFCNGTIAGILSREEATQEKVMSLAFGHEVHA